jgi:N-acetyl-gamma-glutamyl-phosphate reductase
MIRAGIVGATGLVGEGLIRILAAHRGVSIACLTSSHAAGKDVAEELPALAAMVSTRLVAPSIDALAGSCDVVFLAMKSTESMVMVPQLVERGVRCIDIGGEFRFRDAAVYEKWYGEKHEAPALTREAVWGLPEVNREKIARARVVGNPGCYPTGATLGVLPFLNSGLVEMDGIVVSSLSGVSGAGRTYSPKSDNTFLACYENVRAYSIGKHKHTPEIEQALSEAAGRPVVVTFTPHLVPIDRGILSTIYLRPAPAASADGLRAALAAFARGKPFIRVRNTVEEVRTSNVRGTNFCDVSVAFVARSSAVVVTTAIDNTVKGAGGQAVQNMNVMFGLDERTGLDRPGM